MDTRAHLGSMQSTKVDGTRTTPRAVVSPTCQQTVRRLHPVAAALGASSHLTAGSTSGSAEPTGGGKSYAEWVADKNTIRIPLETLVAEYVRVLEKIGMEPERAALVARLIGDNQKDGTIPDRFYNADAVFTSVQPEAHACARELCACTGVYSHGLNRFNGFLKSMSPDADGVPININATPELVSSFGVMEQYDGCMGVGPYNAHFSMGRAIELAQKHGIGCVSLRNTNHWQRGGAYGLQAAESGMIGICWTNTTGNMPPWGSAQVKIGNNPIVFCVPRANGEHVLRTLPYLPVFSLVCRITQRSACPNSFPIRVLVQWTWRRRNSPMESSRFLRNRAKSSRCLVATTKLAN